MDVVFYVILPKCGLKAQASEKYGSPKFIQGLTPLSADGRTVAPGTGKAGFKQIGGKKASRLVVD